MTKLFALDLGNRQVKMVNEKGVRVFPSYYIDADDFGNRTLLNFKKDDRSTSDYVAARDDAFTYVWGKGLRMRNKFVFDSIRFDDRYNSLSFKLLADFALAEMARDLGAAAGATTDVILVTGAPTDDYNADEVAQQLAKALKGVHAVAIDGEDYVVNVKSVTALPQPLGTFVDLTVDEEGYIIEDSPYLDKLVGIVDAGGGTLIIDAVEDMNLQSTLHSQSKDGAFTLYENIVTKLAEKGHTVAATEVEAMLRAGSESGVYTWTPNGLEVYDFSDVVMKARTRYTRRVANLVLATYKDLSKFYKIIVTGGAANLLIEKEFKAVIPQALFIEDSEEANARGFYKYGKNSGLV